MSYADRQDHAAMVYGFFAAACLTLVYHADPAQALWAQKMTAFAALASLSFGLLIRRHIAVGVRGGLMMMTAIPGISAGAWLVAQLPWAA
jgi:hypothetical protein